MRILLQFPEGLKQEAMKHAKKLEKEGHEVIISASPTFGACDLAIDEAKHVKADKLVHFGHAEFHHVDFNVEYVNYQYDADLSILERTVNELKNYRKIGIMTTIQHIHQLDNVKRFYEEHSKEVVVGKPFGFAKVQGQILGCDIGSAARIDKEVDAFVYFGGGLFHPLGALYSTTKPFLLADPFNNKVEMLDYYRDEYKRDVRARMARSMNAKNFGILVSTKNGQYNMNLAKVLKSTIEKNGFNAVILVANSFDFDSLNNMLEIDAFVNTACPRLVTDDTERLRKPLLSANELIDVIKMKKEEKEIA